MYNLSEHEWLTITDIIYAFNESKDNREARKQALLKLRSIIPYCIATFWLGDTTMENVVYDPVGVDFSEYASLLYSQYYYKVDYSKHLYLLRKPLIFRDSDIIEQSERRNTEFYNDYLMLPEFNWHYVVTVTMANQNGLFGMIDLCRSKQYEDFSERELFILQVLEKHFANRLFKEKQQGYALSLIGKESLKSSFDADNLAIQYNLTKKEIEIVGLILKGLTSNEISDANFITQGTAKRHIHDIYQKLKINNRFQLMSIVCNENTEI